MTANIYSNSVLKQAISPQVLADDTGIVGSIIDAKDFSYLEFHILIGAFTDADATVAITVRGANLANFSDAVAVDDDILTNTEASAGFTFANDNEVRKIGVKKLKYRYYSVTLTPTNNGGDLPVAVSALLLGAKYEPVTQPSS
jgi:hypothetical protein